MDSPTKIISATIIALLWCCSTAAKPVFPDSPLLNIQAFKPEPRDQEIIAAFQVEANLDRVTEGSSDDFEMGSSIQDVDQGEKETNGQRNEVEDISKDQEHNKTTSEGDARSRIARDTGNSFCVKKIEWKWDSCRKAFVQRFHCLNSHISCYDSIVKYKYPKCITVYGYRNNKFLGKCRTLPLACQCAA
ncbi:PREDICTED: uncharacterized protein LOC107349504 [Acropora digitifera]|uniref:uncharacterized protein LOC107349504 n=1 Tax=Acropora digitifera TaxID=70779 RepID=UPI00077A9833|nr:PREDICTED: uncharacterized protein LOC107349504 [Acropora digitifera]